MLEFVPNHSSLLSVLAVFVLFFIYWYRKPRRFPPGPRGIPFVGYTPVFKNPHEEIYRLSKKYGPVLSVRLGLEDLVFLNDFDSIYQVFVKQGAKTCGRPRFAAMEKVTKGKGIVLVDYGDFWKSQRKFGLRTLRGLGVGKKIMEDVILEESHYLNEEIKTNNGKAFNISLLLHEAVANVVCNVVFGNRFEYDDERFIKMLDAVIAHLEDPLISFSEKIVTFIPKSRFIPPISWGVKKLNDSLRDPFDWFNEIIEEHERSFDENNLRDFIDAFILEKRKENDASFSSFQLLIYIHDLMVAGTDSTSGTILWALLCFLHFPESQKKLRNEVLEVVGSSGKFSMANKSQMPYTVAFMEEVFRFRTLAPLQLPHVATEDVKVNGFVIPNGTTIQANLWAIHNDTNLWKDPHKFMPERFLDEQGNFVKSTYTIPFSVGPRHCLGEQLARMEIFIFLVGMVQKFEFLPDPESTKLPTIDKATNGFVYLPLPYKLVAKEL